MDNKTRLPALPYLKQRHQVVDLDEDTGTGALGIDGCGVSFGYGRSLSSHLIQKHQVVDPGDLPECWEEIERHSTGN